MFVGTCFRGANIEQLSIATKDFQFFFIFVHKLLSGATSIILFTSPEAGLVCINSFNYGI